MEQKNKKLMAWSGLGLVVFSILMIMLGFFLNYTENYSVATFVLWSAVILLIIGLYLSSRSKRKPIINEEEKNQVNNDDQVVKVANTGIGVGKVIIGFFLFSWLMMGMFVLYWFLSSLFGQLFS